MAKACRGFTLFELAMILIILALLSGGIVVGQSIVRSSQIRAVAGEVARYTQAVADFRDKYQALPGDFSGATALWGSADGVVPSDAACRTTASAGLQATCDGNGDGRITTQAADAVANEYEQFRAWQHLANAGMIDGSFTGVSGADAMQAGIGSNVPASQLPGAGYSLISVLCSEFSTPATCSGTVGSLGSAHYFTGVNYQHMLQFGAAGAKSTLYPIITTEEAQLIDSKLDDGYPGMGKIMGPRSDSVYSPNCTTTTAAGTAAYKTSQSGKLCSLLFLLGF